MSKHGTTTANVVPGYYVTFLKAVIDALPRNIDKVIALGWADNGESLSRTLREALCPPPRQLVEIIHRKQITVDEPDLRFDLAIKISLQTKDMSRFVLFSQSQAQAQETISESNRPASLDEILLSSFEKGSCEYIVCLCTVRINKRYYYPILYKTTEWHLDTILCHENQIWPKKAFFAMIRTP